MCATALSHEILPIIRTFRESLSYEAEDSVTCNGQVPVTPGIWLRIFWMRFCSPPCVSILTPMVLPKGNLVVVYSNRHNYAKSLSIARHTDECLLLKPTCTALDSTPINVNFKAHLQSPKFYTKESLHT